MFYLAVFPQFIIVGETTALASFKPVFIPSLINGIWFSAMVLLMSRLTGVSRSGTFQRWLKGVTGMVFIGFRAKLVSYRPEV